MWPKCLLFCVLQGVMGRVASWFGGSSSSRNGSANSRSQRHGSSSSSGVPDFLSQADDPDKRRVDQSRSQSRGVHVGLAPLTISGLRAGKSQVTSVISKHADATLCVSTRAFALYA